MREWFHNLKVSQKLMLISIFFVMPDSLMLYLFITGINENIRFAQMEKKGNEYQRPLEALLKLLPEHRLLAQRLLCSQAAEEDQLGQKQAEIETALDSLAAVDARLGPQPQVADQGLANRKRDH